MTAPTRTRPMLACPTFAAGALFVVVGACLPVDINNRKCGGNGDCIDGFVCVGQICVEGGVGCATDADCAVGAHCAFQRCLEDTQNPSADQLLNEDCAAFITDENGGDVTADIEDATAVQLVGSLLPLTKAGVENAPGLDRAASIELAARQLNAAGGIAGRRFVVLSCNSDGDVETAKRAMAHLAAAGIPAVVGEAASGITQEVFVEVARPAGVLMVAPSSTSVNLTGLDDDGLLFRTTVSDVRQGAALSQFLLDADVQRIAVLASSETYGATLRVNVRDSLCDEFPCTNADRYLPIEFSEQPELTEVEEHVAALVAFDPELMLIIGQDVEVKPFLDVIAVTAALDEAAILLTDTARKDTVLDGLPRELVERIRGTAPAAEPASDTFGDYVLEMNAVFPGQLDSFGPHAYDAAVVIALAHAVNVAALQPTGADLAASLASLAGVGAPPIKTIGLDDAGLNSLQEGLSLLSEGLPIDLDGASGPLDFDANGDVLGDIEIWRRCETGAGDTQVSLGVVLTASNDVLVVEDVCPSCEDVGCPDGTACITYFGDPILRCWATCEGSPCTTRLDEEGACFDAGDVNVCAVLSPLNARCGAPFQADCDFTQAAFCSRTNDPQAPVREGVCTRPCDLVDPTTCVTEGTPAETCGCGTDGALACSADVVLGSGDGVCAPPTQAGDFRFADIGELGDGELTLCTGALRCDGVTQQCE